MSLNDVLTLSVAAVVAGVGLAAFIKAVLEYRQQGRQKRAERFFELRDRLKGREEFLRLTELPDMGLGKDAAGEEANQKLREIPFGVKREYLGLFEEVAIAVNSGLIGLKIAHYMFGYYAILCQNSDAFWCHVNRQSAYWALFNDFCDQMRHLDGQFARPDFVFQPGDYHF